MNSKKAKKITAILLISGIIMPIAGMFLMLRTELLAVALVISFAEMILGAVLSARLYSCDDILDETQETGS